MRNGLLLILHSAFILLHSFLLPSPMPLLGRPSAKDATREAAYRQWFARQHPFALVSLLLSAFSLTHFGTLFVDEAAGIVLGVVTLRQLARARRAGRTCPKCGYEPTEQGPPPAARYCPKCGAAARTEGDWLAWAGIAVGLVSLGCAVVVYVVLKPRR
jgi:uncharacterized membrane protein YfcA